MQTHGPIRSLRWLIVGFIILTSFANYYFYVTYRGTTTISTGSHENINDFNIVYNLLSEKRQNEKGSLFITDFLFLCDNKPEMINFPTSKSIIRGYNSFGISDYPTDVPLVIANEPELWLEDRKRIYSEIFQNVYEQQIAIGEDYSSSDSQLENIILKEEEEEEEQNNIKRGALIIPVRNRCTQLTVLLSGLTYFLHNMTAHQIDIYVVEQCLDCGNFAKGILFNTGILKSLERERKMNFLYDYYIFHDVDHVPVRDENAYNYANFPIHRLSHRNDRAPDENTGVREYGPIISHLAFGGVTQVPREIISFCNGFSNQFFGWGREDNDFYQRVNSYIENLVIPSEWWREQFGDEDEKEDGDVAFPYAIDENVGLTWAIPHERNERQPKDWERNTQLWRNFRDMPFEQQKERMRNDGYRNTMTETLTIQENRFFSMYTVKVDESYSKRHVNSTI